VGLQEILAASDRVEYAPRTLEIRIPDDLTGQLSRRARAFLAIAYSDGPMNALELNRARWKEDRSAVDFFHACDEDTRVEILTFMTAFVHEYTHRVDFLISPFGLQYYANTLREYWRLQEFFPAVLDNRDTVQYVRFLAGLSDDLPATGFADDTLATLWKTAEQLIHIFYAWGDASTVMPLAKYIAPGWSPAIVRPADYFGAGIDLEPVTVLNIFYTFRLPGGDDLWYLRPLTIFETKAVVNALLFILNVLGDAGRDDCVLYYETVYLRRKAELSKDYFFLLDLGARLYDEPDFHTLLRRAEPAIIRSTLLMLSAMCWYALQAPPPLKDEDPRVANPILRLCVAYRFLRAAARGGVPPFATMADGLIQAERSRGAAAYFQKPIKAIIADCVKIIDNMIALNAERTWNPEVRQHFDHIFTLMRPHFAGRGPTYVSYIGMPDSGSPFLGCATAEDWELMYDDYAAPAAAKEWFGLRTDLFFNLLKPAEDLINRLDAHYLAFLTQIFCECGAGTMTWASRFAQTFSVTCAACGRTQTWDRSDATIHHVRPPDAGGF
jgi:hypothetical protein